LANKAAIDEYSAGGVVFRRHAAEGAEGAAPFEIAVVQRARHDDWSLPKGHIEAGESREQAAIREVQEETGLDARILYTLGDVVYYYRRRNGDLVRKTVYHYLMEATSTELGPPNWEVSESRWIPINEARTLLTYQKDKGIVSKAIAELRLRFPDQMPQ
jgi:8-oxo-dGTP pyrophosphatase MutT (NUDIX family)